MFGSGLHIRHHRLLFVLVQAVLAYREGEKEDPVARKIDTRRYGFVQSMLLGIAKELRDCPLCIVAKEGCISMEQMAQRLPEHLKHYTRRGEVAKCGDRGCLATRHAMRLLAQMLQIAMAECMQAGLDRTGVDAGERQNEIL